MEKRYVAIWFRYLLTDWFAIRQPALREAPFVTAAPERGRMIITATNALAAREGITPGMSVEDARAILPSIPVLKERAGITTRLIKGLAEWCVRYTPAVAIDPPQGLLLDATGCAHLWGGEEQYLQDIITRLKNLGYDARAAMADTIGAAWAVCHFQHESMVVAPKVHTAALLPLPPAALRLEAETVDRLQKLGLKQIGNFIGMPRNALRKRFGQQLLQRIDHALGNETEPLQPIHPIEPYCERLPCLEPVVTATAIEIALKNLLQTLCGRLQKEGKGLRMASLKGFRVDGKIEKIEIGTTHASHNYQHLFKLFELKLSTIEPALGIELFLLEAPKVEDVSPAQEKLWETTAGINSNSIAELLDRITGRIGENQVYRFVPDEHYWPERSFKPAPLNEKPTTNWKADKPRPVQLLSKPQPILVTAPIPDYPPMSFRYQGKLHKVMKADGPERIEQEWWIQEGQHRDYYNVEDEEGNRYWLFRSGHYDAGKTYQWFIHGFFA
ncbi:MAG TPA: DNA polymerase Y family protein [Chitinophagaceae bacterium]|nr:DNA polymerase Y family protein [Chitinophagaceae bacterium]